MYKEDYTDLLRQFADSLTKSQLPSLGGGLFCSSCKVIHGRCIDAIYGLSIAYKTFKDEKYLNTIRGLLDYSKNFCLQISNIIVSFNIPLFPMNL